MTRVVMAIVASSVLVAFVPAAHATTGLTDPVARPSIVYPYVRGGRPDATVIAFDRVPHPTLSVYDFADELLFRAQVRNGYVWDPRVDGNVLGAGLTDDEGRVFRVCVNRRGTHTIGSRYCTKVRVVHVRTDAEVSRKRLGRVFYRKTADVGCAVQRRNLAVVINCERDASAVVRYDIDRPSLTGEQSFLGPAAFAWKGRYYRWGDGLGLERTIRGAKVTASGGFSGRLCWVKKIWTVRTEY
jgi:hypothetical protein